MRPVSLTARRQEQELAVVWDDGHASLFPFHLLRAACPCAACRGGHEKMGPVPDPSVFEAFLPDSPAVRLANLVPVGTYAVSPVWEDGHDAGIFRWEYLRALCPCEACRAESR